MTKQGKTPGRKAGVKVYSPELAKVLKITRVIVKQLNVSDIVALKMALDTFERKN